MFWCVAAGIHAVANEWARIGWPWTNGEHSRRSWRNRPFRGRTRLV